MFLVRSGFQSEYLLDLDILAFCELAEKSIRMDYERRAEDAQMARLVQHDVSHKKGDGGGKSYRSMLKRWIGLASSEKEIEKKQAKSSGVDGDRLASRMKRGL